MSAGKPVYYIQLYNQQHDPVFMELSTGKLLWTLPNENVLCNVLYVAHVSDDGRFYYENVDNNQVSWELPKAKMAMSAVDTAELVIKATRKVTEKRVGQPYDGNKSTQQMLTLDAYLQSKDELNQKSSSSTAANTAVNNPFLQGAMESDDEEDNRNTFSRPTFSERPSRLSLKTSALVKKNPIKSGYLMKLATVSGRNWKKRFFTLTSYYLAYYDDENSASSKKPKGELQILPDASVREETVDKKYGYGFRYANAVESIVLAASTEIDRAHWIQTIQSLIQQSATHLKAILTVLPFSTVFANQNLKNYFGASNKVPARKYCILTDEVLSVHPTKETTTTIDGIININEMTKIDCVEQAGGVFIINLTDSDTKQSKLSLQFNSGVDDEKFYRLWKNKLMTLIHGGDPSTFVTRPTAATTASKKEDSRPTSVKAEVPKNVAVFGLSLDDDEDDDDDNNNNNADTIPAITTSNVPFGRQRSVSKDDSDPSPEAKSEKASTSTSPSTTISKRPSKPLGKSYLKMKAARASQSKERASVTETTSTTTTAAASVAKKETTPAVERESNNVKMGGSGGVFGMGFDPDDDDDDYNNATSAPPVVSNPIANNNPAAAMPPPPPPAKKMDSSELDSPIIPLVPIPTANTNTSTGLNPLAAGRRRSVHVAPPSADNTNNTGNAVNPAQAQSLFLQSLKQKMDHPFLQPTSGGFVEEGENPYRPPPPAVPAAPPTATTTNWSHPNSLHDFASNNTPFSSNPVIPQATRRRSGAEAANTTTNTAIVNALEYSQVQLRPEEYEDPMQAHHFPSLLPKEDPHQIDLSTRSLSEMSLQEYLSTPIELRSSQTLDQIFAQPTDSFLQQTHQLLLQSKEQMKTLLATNHNLLPLLSRSKNIVLEKKKSTFSLEKIEEYLQSHSIFSGQNNNSNTYQQLLQEKEIILNLLQFMKLSEQTMIDTIQLYEAEALERIQNEGNHYKQELLQVEHTLKELHQQHYQEISQHTAILDQAKSLLKQQFDEFQSSQQESLQALVAIAKDLQLQQQQISLDRKKMLKQRYQLDVLLQDINDVQQLPNGMNYPVPPLPSPPVMYNNGFGNQPMMNPMMNYSTDSFAQQQQRQAMMMMGINPPSTSSPVMMQELMNSSGGGFPYSAPPTLNSSSSHFSNSLGSRNGSNLPTRSLSPSGGRLAGIGGNLTAAQAASFHYSNNNRSQSPHSMNQNYSNNDLMMQPPLPPDENEMMMHVDELADHRVGRSRLVQPNNINALSRGRSRSPGAAAIPTPAAPTSNVTPLLRLTNNYNLTKQQLLQHQMMQQQQQNQTYGNPLITSTNSSSRGTSPSPYYPTNNTAAPTHAQVHNIQVNLNQIKKHSMANQHRKPFK